MNQSPVSPSMYRASHQQYAPMTSPAVRPHRPRFGFHAPFPYPRPRSSASKPNPSSIYSSCEKNLFDNNDYYLPNHDLPYNSPAKLRDEGIAANNAYMNNSSFMSEDDDSSYVTCPDTSFSARAGLNYSMRSASHIDSGSYSNSYSGNNINNYKNFTPSFSGTSTPKFSTKMQSQPSVGGPGYDNTQTNFKKVGMKRKAPAPPQPLKRCDLCNLDFTSQIPLDMHLRGTKHMKKIKALETLKMLQSQGHAKPNDTVTNQFRCEACSVTLNGALQLQTHFEGSKHKNKVKEIQSKLEATLVASEASQQNGGQPKTESSVSAMSDVGDEPKASKLGKFACDICNLIVNSQIQLQQHLGSKKHQAKVEGKPIGKKRMAKKKAQVVDDTSNEEEIKVEASAVTTESSTEPVQTLHGIPPLSSTFVHKETLN